MPTADVRDNPARNRFEVFLDGTLAGFVTYDLEGETYALTHTEVFPQYGAHGIGTALIVETLTQIRHMGGMALPYCAFIPRVIRDHPEFIHVVPAEAQPQFGLQ